MWQRETQKEDSQVPEMVYLDIGSWSWCASNLPLPCFVLRPTRLLNTKEPERRQWPLNLGGIYTAPPSPQMQNQPGKYHGWRSLAGCSPWGREESDTTEQLHFHFHALEKEMATHSSVLAWRIPGKGEPGGLPSMGSHRVGHEWSDAAAAAAAAAGWIDFTIKDNIDHCASLFLHIDKTFTNPPQKYKLRNFLLYIIILAMEMAE